MQKVSFKRILSSLTLVLSIGGVIGYVYSNPQDFVEIENIQIDKTIYLAVATLIYVVAQGLILKAVVEPFGISLRFMEWFGIQIVTIMSNYIFPAAGVGFRAAYLKRTHNLSYTDFISTLTALTLSEFFIYSLGGLLGVSYMALGQGISSPLLILLFAGLSITFALCFVFPIPLPQGKHRFMHRAKTLFQSWNKIRGNKTFVSTLLIYTTLELVANVFMFYFAYMAFNWTIPFLANFLVACLSDFSLFIRVAPAALGTFEATVLYANALYGLTVSQGLTVIFLVRFVSIAIYFSLGPIFSYILAGGRLRKSESSPLS